MKLEYFIVLGICVVVPFIKSFSREISFYGKPLRLLYAVLIPFVIFLLWDIWAVRRGHWNYNPEYVTGFEFLGLPVEEILFFVVIPFCGIFTWECVKYFRKGKQ